MKGGLGISPIYAKYTPIYAGGGGAWRVLQEVGWFNSPEASTWLFQPTSVQRTEIKIYCFTKHVYFLLQFLYHKILHFVYISPRVLVFFSLFEKMLIY